MLSSPDPLATSEYQRTIVASVIDLLDGLQALVPANPATFVWEGASQRQYVDELGRLRDEIWVMQSLLRETLSGQPLCHA